MRQLCHPPHAISGVNERRWWQILVFIWFSNEAPAIVVAVLAFPSNRSRIIIIIVVVCKIYVIFASFIHSWRDIWDWECLGSMNKVQAEENCIWWWWCRCVHETGRIFTIHCLLLLWFMLKSILSWNIRLVPSHDIALFYFISKHSWEWVSWQLLEHIISWNYWMSQKSLKKFRIEMFKEEKSEKPFMCQSSVVCNWAIRKRHRKKRKIISLHFNQSLNAVDESKIYRQVDGDN